MTAIGALVLMAFINLIYGKQWKYLVIMIICVAIASAPITPFGKRIYKVPALNGRDVLFMKGWEHVKKAPILGVGVGNMHFNDKQNNTGPHNMYLQIHSFGGVAALALFILPLFFQKRFSISIATYLVYGIVSDCAAHAPPNNIIYWALLAQNLPRDMYDIRLSNKKFTDNK